MSNNKNIQCNSEKMIIHERELSVTVWWNMTTISTWVLISEYSNSIKQKRKFSMRLRFTCSSRWIWCVALMKAYGYSVNEILNFSLFYWSVFDLQYFFSFGCIAKWFSCTYMHVHFTLFSVIGYSKMLMLSSATEQILVAHLFHMLRWVC